jgi:transposase-like protein
MAQEPKSLQDAILYFSDQDNCIDYLASRRWTKGVICPICGSEKVSAFNPKRRTWKCGSHHLRREFSVKVGTIFEDSPIGLDKWLAAIWMLVNCKNGISSYEVARDLNVTQKTAWFLLHRIRLAMQNGSILRIGGDDDGGPVEVDECYIGGKFSNMHLQKRERMKNCGLPTKAVVMGMLDRTTREVRAKVIPGARRDILQQEILDQVVPGSKVYTDGLPAYETLAEKEFVHETVNHITEYVRGEVHTQGIENFWSLLKRGLNGTYVSVEPFHLRRYVDEQAFRFNNRSTRERKVTDYDRFALAVSQIVGKRITFAELTGKAPN